MHQTTINRIIDASNNVIRFPVQRREDDRFEYGGRIWTESEWAEYEAHVHENFG